MTIEVMKSTNQPPPQYTKLAIFLYDFAVFCHSSVNLKIIDSYSTVYGRYKGDPLASPVHWPASAIGTNGSWVVVEGQTVLPGHEAITEKWQALIQIRESQTGFYDISDPTGVKYPRKNNGGRFAVIRFSPWGGWNLADTLPDFVVAGVTNPSCDNLEIACSNNSASDDRWWIVAGPGWFEIFSQYNQGAYNFEGMGCFCGDVKEVTTDWPMPRALLCRESNGVDMPPTNGPDNNGIWLAQDNCTTGSYVKMVFADHNKLWTIDSFSVPGVSDISSYTSPNQHAGGMQLDLYPFIPIPVTKKGVWFSVPGLRRIQGIGNTLFDNKQWLSTADAFTLAMPWDGSTSLY